MEKKYLPLSLSMALASDEDLQHNIHVVRSGAPLHPSTRQAVIEAAYAPTLVRDEEKQRSWLK